MAVGGWGEESTGLSYPSLCPSGALPSPGPKGIESTKGQDCCSRGGLPNHGKQSRGKAQGCSSQVEGRTGESTAHQAEGTQHTGRGGDLSVFAQQAHVGLNKGQIFFLHVGRVSGQPGSTQDARAPCYLSLHTCSRTLHRC